MKRKIILSVIIVCALIAITIINNLPMKKIELGDQVPAFTLEDQNGLSFVINNKVNKPMVIYFYPKDDTPGCIKEACKFRDEFEKFKDIGVLVIGISADNVSSHKKFKEKYNLPFTL